MGSSDTSQEVNKTGCIISLVVTVVIFFVGLSGMEDPGTSGYVIAFVISGILGTIVLGTMSMTQKAEKAADTIIASGKKPTVSVADELTKLSALRESGAITDAEYEQQKARLLNG